MKKSLYLLLICLILMLGLGSFALHLYSNKKELPVLGSAPSFQLVDATGSRFSSKALKDKVWIFNFFFASCDGPCPIINSNMRNIYKSHELDDSFELVSISIDPERDTPDNLAQYADKMGVSTDKWHFLTGEYEEIKSLAQTGFKVGGMESRLSHSNRILLIDRQGRIRAYYHGTEKDEVSQLQADLAHLLDR